MKHFHRSKVLGRPTTWRYVLTLCGFLLAAGLSGEAHARRGLMVINTGEDAMSIREVPAEVQAELGLPAGSSSLQVGIKYSRFGVFFLDIARWNSEFCLFTEEADGFSYEPATPAQIAESTGIPEAEIKRPIRYYLPPGGVLIGLVLAVGVPFVMLSSRADAKRKEALMADPRYQSAVNLFHTHGHLTPEQRLAEATNYLASAGIPPQEAHENLKFLCEVEDE